MVPLEWLDSKITVEQAEAANPGVKDERVTKFPDAAKPFGFRSGEWTALKRDLQPGDEIWTFASPADDWKNHAGRAGIGLVRHGKVIKVIITIRN